MAYCKKFKGILRSYNFDGHSIALIRVRCKMWSCPFCAIKNAQMWRYSIIQQVKEKFSDKLWSFSTVTISLKDFDELDRETIERRSAMVIKNNFDKLMKRLKRQYGKFEYVRVLEQHQSGQLHIHMLASFEFKDLYMEGRGKGKKKVSVSKSFKEHCQGCGFGWVTHAENLIDPTGEQWNAVRAVSYVTKYITKETQDFADFRSGLNVRKIQTSRGLLSPFNEKNKEADDNAPVWLLSYAISLNEAIHYEFSVYDLNRKQELTMDDFNNDSLSYPPIEI